ncbi:jagunal isoform X2 [Dermatophagoides farinae]|uniref:Jagn1p n=1 Tax=Dermatophagoides farinae TaxID=6954 RepID=A0A922HYM1_DERFA|nr:Jagn1p [Dermatophagoides farinae]
MASKGKYVIGTDGTDYQHRQRVVSAHSFSAISKHYLKITFYLHFLLYLLIILKLSEDILDRMDIFILELQELEIPKPDIWEWTYGLSFLFTIFGARAIRTNSFRMIKYYLMGIGLFAFIPIVWAQQIYFMDFYNFIYERDITKLQFVWHNLPLSVIFEAFSIIAIQVHIFQLYYAYKLYKLWKPYSQRRQQQQQQQQSSSSSTTSSSSLSSLSPSQVQNSSTAINNGERMKKFN